MASSRGLRLAVAELLRTPGLTRGLTDQVPTTQLDLEGIDPLTDPGVGRILGDLDVDLQVESTIDGLVLRGAVGVTCADECRRCLRAVEVATTIDVEEIFQPAPAHGGSLPEGITLLESEMLDLAPVVRDAALLALVEPPPVCRPDCAGLCPECGQDRNEVPCTCETEVRDLRWAALEGLGDLPPGPPTEPPE